MKVGRFLKNQDIIEEEESNLSWKETGIVIEREREEGHSNWREQHEEQNGSIKAERSWKSTWFSIARVEVIYIVGGGGGAGGEPTKGNQNQREESWR